MHRERLLKLLEILIKYTDMDHKLSINEIVDQLSELGVLVSNRKTLYEDFKLKCTDKFCARIPFLEAEDIFMGF